MKFLLVNPAQILSHLEHVFQSTPFFRDKYKMYPNRRPSEIPTVAEVLKRLPKKKNI
jgi:hypothetical protein